MKIILVMVTSLDGRSTKWNNSKEDWTSPEDKTHFKEVLNQFSLIIMGRKTFDAAKFAMKHTPHRLRVVLSKNPEQHKSETISGMLEFSKETPTQLVKRLSPQFSQALLVSGASVNSLFFNEQLIDEIWLTLEPKIFGKGNGIVGLEEFNINLQLLSMEKMNQQGTLLLKYKVLK